MVIISVRVCSWVGLPVCVRMSEHYMVLVLSNVLQNSIINFVTFTYFFYNNVIQTITFS